MADGVGNANGNQTAENGTTFAYNAADQTTSITPSDGSVTTMGYTGEGQGELLSDGSATFKYDITGIVSMSDSSGTYSFTRAPDGELLEEKSPARNTYLYMHDNLDSVVGLVSASTSALVDQYDYDPYGNVIYSVQNQENPFGYLGQYWDSSTGLYKLGERFYDPTFARFTQPDPIPECNSGSASPQPNSRYAYANDDPINNSDPTGLRSHHHRHSHRHGGSHHGGHSRHNNRHHSSHHGGRHHHGGSHHGGGGHGGGSTNSGNSSDSGVHAVHVISSVGDGVAFACGLAATAAFAVGAVPLGMGLTVGCVEPAGAVGVGLDIYNAVTSL